MRSATVIRPLIASARLVRVFAIVVDRILYNPVTVDVSRPRIPGPRFGNVALPRRVLKRERTWPRRCFGRNQKTCGSSMLTTTGAPHRTDPPKLGALIGTGPDTNRKGHRRAQLTGAALRRCMLQRFPSAFARLVAGAKRFEAQTRHQLSSPPQLQDQRIAICCVTSSSSWSIALDRTASTRLARLYRCKLAANSLDWRSTRNALSGIPRL